MNVMSLMNRVLSYPMMVELIDHYLIPKVTILRSIISLSEFHKSVRIKLSNMSETHVDVCQRTDKVTTRIVNFFALNLLFIDRTPQVECKKNYLVPVFIYLRDFEN